MESTRKIAILLKHNQNMEEARLFGEALMESGAQVTFLCMCRDQGQNGFWNIQSLLDTRADCYTNDADLAGRYDLDCLSITALTDYIQGADWVIPF